ncbi:MAG: DUF86 domain-containing protein [Planctomycetes bacterium]|nr:DUF86 domain-containing protein [Planctomycetota bacterium]
MTDRDHSDYLSDIATAIADIEDFIDGMTFDEFSGDTKTIYAVVRALEIIGEATKNLPENIRNIDNSIPWRKMAGMRDILIHAYHGVDKMVVWKTATEDIPGVAERIEALLSDEESQT